MIALSLFFQIFCKMVIFGKLSQCLVCTHTLLPSQIFSDYLLFHESLSSKVYNCLSQLLLPSLLMIGYSSFSFTKHFSSLFHDLLEILLMVFFDDHLLCVFLFLFKHCKRLILLLPGASFLDYIGFRQIVDFL